MQHPTMQTNLTESPFTVQIIEGEAADDKSGMLSKIIDNSTTNTITKSSSSSSPPTQMAHDLNEPKNFDSEEKISNLTTIKITNSDRMSQAGGGDGCGGDGNGGDAIDCAAIVLQKANHHELISAPNGGSTQSNGCCLQQQLPSTTTTPTSTYHHKDGHYFLKLFQSEKSRLLTMADQAERDMCVLTTSTNNEISDEIFGIIRSVSGKTRLLVSQKLKQFEGLCHSHLNPTPDEKCPTTIEDLLGFWDMVNLQIEHIDSLFKELDLIKANNWQTTKDPASPYVPTGSRLIKKPTLKNNKNNNTCNINNNNGTTASLNKQSPNALLMAQKRDMQRKQLLEMKRKNKTAAAATATDKGLVSSPIEIYVTENVV